MYDEIKDDTYRQYDYHITSGSPAIGGADIEKSTLAPIDLDGNDRLSDWSSDIGCYEYKP